MSSGPSFLLFIFSSPKQVLRMFSLILCIILKVTTNLGMQYVILLKLLFKCLFTRRRILNRSFGSPLFVEVSTNFEVSPLFPDSKKLDVSWWACCVESVWVGFFDWFVSSLFSFKVEYVFWCFLLGILPWFCLFFFLRVGFFGLTVFAWCWCSYCLAGSSDRFGGRFVGWIVLWIDLECLKKRSNSILVGSLQALGCLKRSQYWREVLLRWIVLWRRNVCLHERWDFRCLLCGLVDERWLVG